MEMKMAEVFGSEGMKNLHLRGALVLTGPEVEAAVLAVKNHDRLVLENKRMLEALKNAVFVRETFNKDLVDGYRTRDKEFAVEMLSNCAVLLLELEKGNE
ncbi:hypothetical protein FXE84_17795 [Vibrio cholerae]|uniref:hypothetical protein n=1 Tax=Vibrio cholerae TaxID=666 RepID=UPI0004E2B1B5|nr:hypothetical protein [Vibrio cholerae]KFE28224.1 hypothetical protein DN30_1165 [Vibrio cholerae]TXY40921.1 hypothetical protein FXE84_17795 [Vibrio cholerae]GHW89952.1 hypothetical protein VCSRO105_0595 [Vibrio cholerae]